MAPTRNFSLATEGSPQKTWLISPQRIGLYLAILAFLHGLVYLALIPPWQAPDEPQHFWFIKYLADGKGLPVQGQGETSGWEQEGSQPGDVRGSHTGAVAIGVTAAREGGASLDILSGFVAGNFSAFWLGIATTRV